MTTTVSTHSCNGGSQVILYIFITLGFSPPTGHIYIWGDYIFWKYSFHPPQVSQQLRLACMTEWSMSIHPRTLPQMYLNKTWCQFILVTSSTPDGWHADFWLTLLQFRNNSQPVSEQWRLWRKNGLSTHNFQHVLLKAILAHRHPIMFVYGS